MLTLGSEAIVKTTKQTGVIMRWNPKNAGYLIVKVWDVDMQKYKEISVHPVNLAEIANPLFATMVNDDDKAGMEISMEVAIDLALATGDKKWFDKLVAQKKRVRKSRKETELDRSRIKLGSVVCDLNGQYLGVVTTVCKYYSDQLLISCWNPAHGTYITYRRAIHLVKLVEHKRLTDWMNNSTNYKDLIFRERYKEAAQYLAVETHDKRWFESTVEKETSDGA